jgi:hypothetical protein
MKFFTNLPKTTFQSSIGTFTVSDFFTYLDVENVFVDTGTFTIDNKTTLIEAAARLYNDPDTFWSFVVANDIINPFDLLAENVTQFVEDNKEKISLVLYNDPDIPSTATVVPVGSLIVPFSANSGACYSMGSTGNFTLNGPFAIVEETSFYDGNMTISVQYGTTSNFITVSGSPEKVTVLEKNADGSYVWGNNWYAMEKVAATDKVVAITSKEDGKIIYKRGTSSRTTPDEEISKSPALAGATAAITAKQFIENQSKTIDAYTQSELGFVQASFVSAKYN